MNNRGNVRNLRFRYTKDKDRIKWAQGVYPYARHFLNLIRGIPFSAYSAHLSSYITEESRGSNSNEGFALNVKSRYAEKKGRAIPKKYPYRLFGGAACEILNAAFPKAGRLHNFADPTADIDVMLDCPLFVVDEPVEYDYMYNVYRDDLKKISPLAEHYMNWVFDRVAERLPELARHFQGNAKFERPLAEETEETAEGLRFHSEGVFLLSLLVSSENMIKIQITTKYAGVADHVVEFVLPSNEDLEVKDDSAKSSFVVDKSGLVIEEPLRLLGSQVQGLIDRQEIGEDLKYKLINHYGRVMYLVNAIRWLVDNKYMETPYWSKFSLLLKAIKEGAFKRDDVCPLPVGCSLKAVIEPIRPFLVNAPRWKPIIGGGAVRKTKKNMRRVVKRANKKSRRGARK